MTTHPGGGAGSGPGRWFTAAAAFALVAGALAGFQSPWGKPKPRPTSPKPPK